MATCSRTRPPSTSFFASFLFFFLLSSSSSTLVLGVRRRDGGRHRASSHRGAVAVNQEAGICAAVVIPYGYKCEEFDVVTEDGYVLRMQRMSAGSRGGGGGAGGGQAMQPVLLQHGLFMDGMTWLMSSPEESLAYILADRGFDVWIANARGTQWSRRHKTLDPSLPAFWNWSWDELAKYDLPATVGFVHQTTGKKLDYVGHSMGTLMALASFSEGRVVMDQLRAAALLCPVAYLSHMTTPLGAAAARYFVDEMYTFLGIAEFDPKGPVSRDLLQAVCQPIYPNVNCYDLLTSFTGKNYCLNGSTVELFLKDEMQPTSTSNMAHFAQTFRDGVVAKFDYGIANMVHYGQVSPPRYDLSAIPGDFPLFLSYGGQDALADVEDVKLLVDDLKLHHDPSKLAVQFIPELAHMDFVIGVCARAKVYGDLITFFDRQNQ